MPQARSDGTTVNYEDTGGHGLPVLLVHAFPLRGAMWEGQVEALSDRFRFIVPDLKGFGSSEAPDDPSQYSMDAFAAELGAVLDAADVPKAAYVGLSIGGYIAFAFFRKYADRLTGLVLADCKAENDPSEVIAKRTAQQEQVKSEGTAPVIEALTGALLSEATREKKEDVVERTRELMDNPPAGFIGALEAMKKRPDS
ncbi:MAG: alpha/beta fold hydrolase, partial [Actinomycetota bacterium]